MYVYIHIYIYIYIYICIYIHNILQNGDITKQILQNRNMLNLKINNHFYIITYLKSLALELICLNNLHQRKHINIFTSLSLTNKTLEAI